MNSYQDLSSHRALLTLVKELFEINQHHHDIYNLQRQTLLKLGEETITKIKVQLKSARQMLKCFEQVRKYKQISDLKRSMQLSSDHDRYQTIKYIVDLKILVVDIANFFNELYHNETSKQIKLQMNSILGSLFSKCNLRLTSQMTKCLNHKFLGWIKDQQVSTFINESNRRLSQINHLKETLQSTQRIKKDMQIQLKLKLKSIDDLKDRLKDMRKKLNEYQGRQIFCPSDDLEDENQNFINPNSQHTSIPQQKQGNDNDNNHTQNINVLITEEKKYTNSLQLTTNGSIKHNQQQVIKQVCVQTDKISFIDIMLQTQPIVSPIKQCYSQTNIIESQNKEIETPSMNFYYKQFEEIYRQKNRAQNLFQGDVFLENLVYKDRLIRHIEQKGRVRINRTRLLYRYDPLNPTNFHRYIDNVEGLALIVKTKNEIFLAGFYLGKLIPDHVLNQFGLLISLTNDESFSLLENQKGKINRSMVYDNYYAIFGNAQLRIKTGQDSLFSNFGIMNSYYNHRGKKVHQFLGEGGNRVAKFETYEFYQVFFQTYQ